MTATVVKLSFTSPVHFGNGRLSDAECACSADTLFSALFMEAMAQGSQEDLLAAARDGDLLLSDAFPWMGDDCYLPKPWTGVSDISLREIANRINCHIAQLTAGC